MSKPPLGRNSSAVRILKLLRLLEQRGRWTTRQLAVRFNVTIRTVWRDLSVLEEAGYPIGHEPRDQDAEARKFGVSGTWWLVTRKDRNNDSLCV